MTKQLSGALLKLVLSADAARPLLDSMSGSNTKLACDMTNTGPQPQE